MLEYLAEMTSVGDFSFSEAAEMITTYNHFEMMNLKYLNIRLVHLAGNMWSSHWK